jgi:4-amino-4-deoxy-L-arabinose transferase-like glycosyltransferase
MSQRVRRTLVIFILLCAFALRLYRLDFQDIWWDEGRNIDVASRSLAVIATAKEMDIHPPLYFYTFHLWMLGAGRSEFAVRFLSVFFSLLTIPLFYRFGAAMGTNHESRITNHVFGLLAATVAAFAPLYISEAQETRMYTMAIFLTTASAYLLYRAWREGGRLLWAGYVLTSALSIYTHYSAGFILIAENAFLALLVLLGAKTSPSPFSITSSAASYRLSLIRRWILSQLSIGVLYLPQVRIALRQIVAYENPTMGVPDLPSFLVEVWQGFSLGPAVELIRATPFLAGIALILVLGLLGFGIWDLVIGSASLKSQMIWLCLWLALPLLLYFYILRDRPFFHPRYIILATPPYYLLLAYALGQIRKRVPAVGLLSVVFLLAAFAPAIWADYFDPASFADDTRGLACFIESQAGENDVVLIDVPYPFDYYYHGRAPAHYLFVDIHTVAQRLTELCQGRERAFWIRWHKSDTDPRGAVLFLLDKYGQPLGQAGFRGYDALWYQLPPHGTFSLTSEVNPIDADFGQISLESYAYGGRGAGATSSEAEVEARVVPAGKKMWAVLQWQLQRKVNRNYKVALFLKDSRGHLIGQDDRQLINDRHLYTSSWWLDEVVTNVYDPLVPDGTPPGQYTVEVAVYEPEGLVRLDVLDANGAPQGTTVKLGNIEVSRPLSPPPVASLGIQHELTADWGEVRLLGYDLASEAATPGAILPLNLYWQALADVQRDYFALIQARDQAGQVWGQVRERPVAGTYPTTLWQEGEVLRDHYELPLSAETPAGQYQLTVGLVDAATESLVGEIALPSLSVEGRSKVFQVPPIQYQLSANLGGQVEMLGYDLDSDRLQAGETVHLTLYWRALDEMEVSYTVFVHLINKENQIWGQRDSVPGNGTLPTTGWVKREVIADEYEFTVRPDTPPGEYLIEVGLYDAQTGQRLPVLSKACPEPSRRIEGPVLGGVAQEDRILLNETVVVK